MNKVFDFKSSIEKNQSKYIHILAYVYSKHSGLSFEESKNIINKAVNKNNEKIFKSILDDKYNKGKLKDMKVDDILKKSIKD
jgi:hypothetical protein